MAVSIQAGAWDLVSRTPLPWGLVPAQAESTSQIALERWMRAAPPRTEIYEVAPCAPGDHAFHTIECSWDADVATLRANRTDLTPVLQPTPEELVRLSAGRPIAFPPDAVVLVNPWSPVYPSVVAQMPAQGRTEFDDGSLQIVRTGP